jgi:serine/threonine protein kinase
VQEKRILQKISHPFCVTLHFAFQDDQKLYLVMNYVGGGNFKFYLKELGRFPEHFIRFYGAELAVTLEYLHDNRILYRDLKLENVMLGMDGHVQLTDFGLAKDFQPDAKTLLPVKRTQTAEDYRGRMLSVHKERTATICGTPAYFAPELIREQEYGPEVDWWTFGILLYELLTGSTPFQADTEKNSFDNILKRSVTFPPYHGTVGGTCGGAAPAAPASVEVRSLISLLLEKDPAKRLGAAIDAQGVKSHFFFQGMDWAALERKELAPPLVPDCEFRY